MSEGQNPMSGEVSIRPAEVREVGVVLQFIRDLAAYEHLEHEVVATEETLREALFGARPYAEVVFGCLAGRGIYLEDLYVRPDARKHGVGRSLLAWLAATALARGCGRLEWAVLNWNEPSIQFYRKLGAVPLDEWTTYRVTGPALKALAGES